MMRINFEEMISEREELERKRKAKGQVVSGSTELHEEEARKAVGSLFDDEPVEPQEALIEAPRRSRMAKVEREVKELHIPPATDNYWDEAKRTERLAEAEAASPNLEAPESLEERRARRLERPRTQRRRYVFTDAEDTYSDLKRKYTEEAKNEEETQTRVEAAPVREPMVREQTAKPARKRSTPNSYAKMEEDLNEMVAEEQTVSGSSSAIRGVALVLAVIFLLMSAYLVYSNRMLSNRLEAASAQAERVPALEEDLSQARIDLEAALIDLADAESRAALALIPPPVQEAPASDADYAAYPEEGAYDAGEEPGQAAPAEPRSHVVARGDNLSRIARHFYGSDSPANIQRIRDANNLTNDVIQVGQRLIIPN